MRDDSRGDLLADPVEVGEWRQELDDAERSLRDASRAIAMLRLKLERADLGASVLDTPAERQPRSPARFPIPDEKRSDSPFERLWDRIEQERMEKRREDEARQTPERHGLDLLPQVYTMTVDERDSKVDLVPLHRALLGLAEVDDVSLVSFANGVPVISLRVEGELDLDRLQEAVSVAMDRECETIPQENGRFHLRLRPSERPGG